MLSAALRAIRGAILKRTPSVERAPHRMRGCSGRIRPKCKEATWLDVELWRPQPVGTFVVIYTISVGRSYLSVIATRLVDTSARAT
jgi:hypothetical protein